MIRSVNIQMCLQGYCRMRPTPSSEESQHQYTLTSERAWFGICVMICGNIYGANSFFTERKEGARTFLNECDCYLQAPDDGAGTFSLEKNWLGRDFFSQKKLIWQRLFSKNNWLSSDFFCGKKNDWAGTVFCKKNWWGTDFFWPGKTFFAPVISQ